MTDVPEAPARRTDNPPAPPSTARLMLVDLDYHGVNRRVRAGRGGSAEHDKGNDG